LVVLAGLSERARSLGRGGAGCLFSVLTLRRAGASSSRWCWPPSDEVGQER